MSSEIAALEADVKEYVTQLEVVVSSLHGDPDNAELKSLKAELDVAISVTQEAIADLKQKIAPPIVSSLHEHARQPSPPQQKEKWSKENHPAFQPGYKRQGAPATVVTTPSTAAEDQPATSHSFKVNDTVMAKWTSGDKGFYPARITSITGSSANPVYLVTFKTYNNSETLRSHDVKPMYNDTKKRKADGSSAVAANLPAPPASAPPPPPPSPPPTHGSSNVISAAANINPDLASQAKREPGKVIDGPMRPQKVPRKVKATKELEAGKSNWQNFTTKGKVSKSVKKESMFRTGESVTARVGFTGSGQAMRKDPTRSRHIYQTNDDDY